MELDHGLWLNMLNNLIRIESINAKCMKWWQQDAQQNISPVYNVGCVVLY